MVEKAMISGWITCVAHTWNATSVLNCALFVNGASEHCAIKSAQGALQSLQSFLNSFTHQWMAATLNTLLEQLKEISGLMSCLRAPRQSDLESMISQSSIKSSEPHKAIRCHSKESMTTAHIIALNKAACTLLRRAFFSAAHEVIQCSWIAALERFKIYHALWLFVFDT